jgi:hypothetical protein
MPCSSEEEKVLKLRLKFGDALLQWTVNWSLTGKFYRK